MWWLIAVIILCIPLGELTRLQIGNSLALSLLDIFIGIHALVLIALSLFKKEIFKTPFTKSLRIFFIFCFLSLFISFFFYPFQFWQVGLLYLIRTILYTLVFFSSYSLSPKSKTKLQYIAVISGLIIVVTGFIQYIYYPFLQNLSYIGWDNHLYRLFGTFFDPNFIGIFLAMYSIFVLHRGLSTKQLFHKYIYVVLFGLSTIALFLTFSRTAYISFGVGFLVYMFYSKVNRKLLLSLLFLFLLGVIFIFFTQQHTEGTDLLRTVSTQERFKSQIQAFSIFLDRPLLGVGFNMYRYAQHDKGYISGPHWQDSHAGAAPDNSYLFVLATTGIIGFLSFIYIWWRVIQVSWGKKSAILLATIAVFLVSGFAINSIFYPLLMVWFWILLGISL